MKRISLNTALVGILFAAAIFCSIHEVRPLKAKPNICIQLKNIPAIHSGTPASQKNNPQFFHFHHGIDESVFHFSSKNQRLQSSTLVSDTFYKGSHYSWALLSLHGELQRHLYFSIASPFRAPPYWV